VDGATTYNVLDGAPDGGDRSAAAPFPTIQQAVDVAQPGDTVDVGAGTYAGFTTVCAGNPGRADRGSGALELRRRARQRDPRYG
jgi:hypothetical protein